MLTTIVVTIDDHEGATVPDYSYAHAYADWQAELRQAARGPHLYGEAIPDDGRVPHGGVPDTPLPVERRRPARWRRVARALGAHA